MEIKNAIITSTFLGFEDHGIFTLWLNFDLERGCQSFGGRKIGIFHIEEILRTLEVENWEKLIGISCRIKGDQSHIGSIGHFIKDNWHTPENE